MSENKTKTKKICIFSCVIKYQVISTKNNNNKQTFLYICHVTVCLFAVCFVPLHPKSTAMVIAGWSVLLTTLFPGQA